MKNAISHRLLKRQFKKVFEGGEVNLEKMPQFLKLINDSYTNFDQDRELNLRAEKISSKELELINEKLLREKNIFLDNFNHGMAHDVKNHTANFKGLLSMLRKYLNLDDRQMIESIADRLEMTISQMINILDGFLYLSKAEGKFDNQLTPIDGEQLTEQIKLEIEYLTHGIEQIIEFNFQTDDLNYSQHILRIIFVNLISNSIKFRKPHVLAKIEAALKYENNEITLIVKDNGVGMDLEDSDLKIFELFKRVEQEKNVKGYGVGLFMIKKILEYNCAMDIENRRD